MNSLSPKARALLDLARRAPLHDPGAVARVRQGIEAQLLLPPAPAAAAAGSTVLTKVLIGGLFAAAVGAAIFRLADRPAPAPTPVSVIAPTAPSPATPAPKAIAPAPVIEAQPFVPPPASVSSRPRLKVVEAPSPSPAPPTIEPKVSSVDALEAERALVLVAREQVRRGVHAEALLTLARADGQFAAGAFIDERRLLTARAHCALGDTEAALVLIRALPEGSPYRAPAMAACHLETDPGDAGHSGSR